MIAWHPSGQVLVSASYDDTVKLWVDDGDEWLCQQTLTGAAPSACSYMTASSTGCSCMLVLLILQYLACTWCG